MGSVPKPPARPPNEVPWPAGTAPDADAAVPGSAVAPVARPAVGPSSWPAEPVPALTVEPPIDGRTAVQNDAKGLIARTVGRLPLDIARIEARAALEDSAALAADLVHIARLRRLRRLPSTAAARAAGR